MQADPIEVGQRIHYIRTQKLTMTMDEFAKKIDDNLTKSSISNWENGHNLPSNQRIKRIAELGNTSIDELLHGNDILVNIHSHIDAYVNQDPDSFRTYTPDELNDWKKKIADNVYQDILDFPLQADDHFISNQVYVHAINEDRGFNDGNLGAIEHTLDRLDQLANKYIHGLFWKYVEQDTMVSRSRNTLYGGLNINYFKKINRDKMKPEIYKDINSIISDSKDQIYKLIFKHNLDDDDFQKKHHDEFILNLFYHSLEALDDREFRTYSYLLRAKKYNTTPLFYKSEIEQYVKESPLLSKISPIDNKDAYIQGMLIKLKTILEDVEVPKGWRITIH